MVESRCQNIVPPFFCPVNKNDDGAINKLSQCFILPDSSGTNCIQLHLSIVEALNALGKFSAPYNGEEVFGKEFKQRRKECSRLDREFDEVFKSECPSWRPYTTPRKSRVERTFVKRTVKELTFENSEDYFNYLVKMKRIPVDVFKQQERVGFVHRLALPPIESQACGTSKGLGVGPRMLRSRSASPCVSTERNRTPASDGLQLMLLSADCARSRECSPSHSPIAMDTSTLNSSASHAEHASQAGSSAVHNPLNETTGEAHDQPYQQSNGELENCTPVALLKSTTPKPLSGTPSVANSGTSSRKRSCRRKATPKKDTDLCGAVQPKPLFDSTNQERPEGETSMYSEKQFTPTVPKKSAGRTPSSTVASSKSTGRNSRKRKASSHSSAGGGDKHPRQAPKTTPNRPDSTPLCSKTSKNLSPAESKQRSASRRSSKKKPDFSQLTPGTSSSKRVAQSSGHRVVAAAVSARKVSAEETPRNTSGCTSAARAKKARNAIAKLNVRSPVVSPSSNISVTTPGSGERVGSSVKKANSARKVCKDEEQLKKQGKSTATPANSGRKPRLRKAQTPPASASNLEATTITAKSEGEQVNQATPKANTKKMAKNAKKKPVVAKSLDNQKTGEQPSKTPKRGQNQKKLKESPPQATPPLVPQNSPPPSSYQETPGGVKSGSRAKRRSDDSDMERVVTPINDDVVACSIWNENVHSIVRSYDDCVVNRGKMGTIFGFDAGEVRQQCDGAQQSTLSMFVNCARKYQSATAESSSVDTGLKEDRRAMAAARIRNRQLTSGYYV
ncbi:hypothetical protein Y032_0215g2363 [Ancylostoma ceylanicum]|uniref:Uncharacterized protein n=1 Tax=Ancylostoma ceylanicum TaxID=53326 RepID=A0A016SK38_9BILA|nr:hypothetical protein Y032_0215g2363 [Ancylostoma ceylanicum]